MVEIARTTHAFDQAVEIFGREIFGLKAQCHGILHRRSVVHLISDQIARRLGGSHVLVGCVSHNFILSNTYRRGAMRVLSADFHRAR